MPVAISPVVSDADLNAFIRLPNRMYRDFKGYAPPLTIDRRALLDPKKAPFFKHGKVQYWLARRDGVVVGRVSAQIDEAQGHGSFEHAGFFGCLDVEDDVEVTRALLEVAKNWLRERGCQRAIGPFVLSMNGEPGMLVEGYEEPPLTMVSWHPPYLADHMRELGYEGCKDLHYWRVSDRGGLVEKLRQRKRITQRAKDVTVRAVNMRDLPTDIEIIRMVYNDAWQDNWGFIPLQPEDVEAIYKDLKPFIRPEYGIIVEKNGKPVGAALTCPNLFEVLTDIGADPSPLGWLKLAYRSKMHRFNSGFVILLGVLSEARNSVGGAVIAMALVDEIINRVLDLKDTSGWLEAGWVLDNNVALQKILLQYGFEKKRTLRLFETPLGPAGVEMART